MPNLNDNPLVSLIITNYNKSNFIIKAINSCLNQKYRNIEIIFFDDKSSDNSLKKIREFKKKMIWILKLLRIQKKKKFSTYQSIIGNQKKLKLC